MTSHIIATFTASILVAIVTGQCPQEQPLTPEEAFEEADNVFLGNDVTDLSGCQANDGGCSRRQIQFQVLCVLKQTEDLSGWDLSNPISIGEARNIEACDRTFFGFGPTQTMIVMVKKKQDSSNRNYLDWHETNNATRAHYVYGTGLESSIGLTCNVENPFDTTKDSCGVGLKDCCANRCRVNVPAETGKGESPEADDIRIWLASDADSDVGVHCCKRLHAGAKGMWISDDSSINRVGAQLLNGNTMPIIEVSDTITSSVTEDERMAVAMYRSTTDGNKTAKQVAWLAVNIDRVRLQDGFVQINGADGISLIDFMPLIPSEGQTVRFEVFKHQAIPANSLPDVSPYKSKCIKTEGSFVPGCLYDLNQVIKEVDLTLLSALRVTVVPDDWSVWTAIRKYDVMPSSACKLVNRNVIPYGDTVLCPAPPDVTDAAVTMAPSTLIMFIMAAIFSVQ